MLGAENCIPAQALAALTRPLVHTWQLDLPHAQLASASLEMMHQKPSRESYSFAKCVLQAQQVLVGLSALLAQLDRPWRRYLNLTHELRVW